MFLTVLGFLLPLIGMIIAVYFFIQWLIKKSKSLLNKAIAFFIGSWLLGIILGALKVYL